MKKIDYYIIKKFLGTFFLSISLIIIIVIIFDISENIEDLINFKATLYRIIFDYYLNFIPYFVNLFSPLFTFIAVIYFTSKMASQTEIIAILGSGISFRRMLRPFMITALFLTLLSFYLSNFLIPHTNKNLVDFRTEFLKNRFQNNNRNIHMQIAPGAFVYVESFNVEDNRGSRFTMERYNNGVLYYKMAANNIIWDSLKEKWTINNYSIHLINGLTEKLITGNKMDTSINMTTDDFYRKSDDLDLMNFSQLYRFIKSEKLKGSDKIKYYEVEQHKRIASPFSTFILTIIGVSVSSRKLRGGIGVHIAYGLALTFIYILFSRITETFATYGNLSPVVAVWIPNVLFMGIALYLLKIAPK